MNFCMEQACLKLLKAQEDQEESLKSQPSLCDQADSPLLERAQQAFPVNGLMPCLVLVCRKVSFL